MELPSHLPRDTGEGLCTRARVVDIGPYVNQQKPDGTYPEYHVTVVHDPRCRPPFSICDTYNGNDKSHLMMEVIQAMFDAMESAEVWDPREEAAEERATTDFYGSPL